MLGQKETSVSALRKPENPVNPIFVNRWSPRAMSAEEISDAELFSLLEAAKWAPSCSNNQPWRFLYARRGTPNWNVFLDLLVPNNQGWAKNAAVLLVIVSKKTFDNDKPDRPHSYDAGAAWGYLALQGSMNGLVVHGMAGFDYDKTKTVLNVPENYQVEAMAAIGKPGRKEDLPPALQEREIPSDRKKISEIAFEGGFKS